MKPTQARIVLLCSWHNETEYTDEHRPCSFYNCLLPTCIYSTYFLLLNQLLQLLHIKNTQ